MAFPVGDPHGQKRAYSAISGAEEYPESKFKRLATLFMRDSFAVIDSGTRDEIEDVVSTLWQKGLLQVSDEGELVIALELCFELNGDRLRKIISYTDWDDKNSVTKVCMKRLIGLDSEIPGILLEAFPELALSCFADCHEMLADHEFYIGDQIVRVNKGILSFASPCTEGMQKGKTSSVLQDVDPAVLRNCLRITTGQRPFFTQDRFLYELFALIHTVERFRLHVRQEKIICFMDEEIAEHLAMWQDSIVRQANDLSALNGLAKLLIPYFSKGKLESTRRVLVERYGPVFCQKLERLDQKPDAALDLFWRVESFLSLLPVQPQSRRLATALVGYMRDRLRSVHLIEKDDLVVALLHSSFVRVHLKEFLGMLTDIHYKELTRPFICNMLTLFECILPMELDPEVRPSLTLKMIDLLQFNLREGDLEKAMIMSEQTAGASAVATLVFVLLLRNEAPGEALAILRAATETAKDKQLREVLKVYLAFYMFMNTKDPECALEYLNGSSSLLSRHLRGYLLAQSDPIPFNDIEGEYQDADFSADPFAFYCAWVLDKEIPQQGLYWNLSFTILSFLASEIMLEMPLEWQKAAFPTDEQRLLFLRPAR